MKKLSTVVLIGLSLLTSLVVFARGGIDEWKRYCEASSECLKSVQPMAASCKSPNCGQKLKAAAQSYCSTNECKKR